MTPLPDDWDWVAGVPEDWDVPAELEQPGPTAEANLAIKMLGCRLLGSEVLDPLGRFISEQALFNAWFHDVAKTSTQDPKGLSELMLCSTYATRSVYDAWKEFEGAVESEAPDAEARLEIQEKASQLRNALNSAIDSIANARGQVG